MLWLAAGLALAALLGSALAPGGLLRSGPLPFAVYRLAGTVSRRDPLGTRFTKVFGTDIPARVYGTEIGDMEDQGETPGGQMTSDLSPVPAAAFAGPTAAYKAYAGRWTTITESAVRVLGRALAAGHRPAAQAEWATAWSDYLHLGAVYGLFGTLDQEIDGTPGVLPGGTSSPRFTGLHRIEMGLWTGARPQSLVRWSNLLEVDLAQLHRVLPRVAIDPLTYATRSHEILEDAQRSLLSGTDVPWSGDGVLGTAAGLAATNEVVSTLVPLLSGRDNALIEVQNELLVLGGVFDRIRREHRGRWPTLSRLTTYQREVLNGTMAGVLAALEQLPGTLETKPLEVVPQIPVGRGK